MTKSAYFVKCLEYPCLSSNAKYDLDPKVCVHPKKKFIYGGIILIAIINFLFIKYFVVSWLRKIFPQWK